MQARGAHVGTADDVYLQVVLNLLLVSEFTSHKTVVFLSIECQMYSRQGEISEKLKETLRQSSIEMELIMTVCA